MSKSRVWGNRNPHQDRDPEGMAKSIKWISVLPGWILLFESSNPLTNRNSMGDNTVLYMKKDKFFSDWISITICIIFLDVSIIFTTHSHATY